MKEIRVGLIGYGLSGRVFHGNILRTMEQYQVVGVSVKSEEKIKQVHMDFPDAKLYKTPDEVFKDNEVELVIIATPNTTHFDLASEAMLHGKHVILEKPFTVTVDEAEKLRALSMETGCILSVYQNRRYDGDYKTLKDIIAEGHLGRIVEFESHFDRFRPNFKENAWREKALPGSGVVYDLGSHLIDQALDLFGDPNEIYADISTQRLGEVDDHFEIILYYDFLKVTLKSGSLVKETLPRFILLGTKGSFVKYGMDPQEAMLKEGISPTSDQAWGEDHIQNWGILNTIDTGRKAYKTLNGDYREFYDNIYKAIRSNGTLAVKASDAVNTMRLIEAAFRSNTLKKRVAFKNEG